MNATTCAVDLAKSVFQLAYADGNWKVIGTARLTRSQFQRCFHTTSVALVIMEACGSAHYWRDRFRRWVSRSNCCPPATSAPMSNAIRPMPRTPPRCSKPHAAPCRNAPPVPGRGFGVSRGSGGA